MTADGVAMCVEPWPSAILPPTEDGYCQPIELYGDCGEGYRCVRPDFFDRYPTARGLIIEPTLLPECGDAGDMPCWGIPPDEVPAAPQPPSSQFDAMSCYRQGCSADSSCPYPLVCIGGYVPSAEDPLAPLLIDGEPMCVNAPAGIEPGPANPPMCEVFEHEVCGMGPQASRCVYPEVLERWPILETLRIPPPE